jgi:hypothetical protein
MKLFVERIKNDFDYEWAYSREPVYFKTFLWFLLFWGLIVKGLFCVLLFVTVPIWILPYFVWWNKKQRSNNNAE